MRNLRVLIAAVFCLAGLFVAVFGVGAFSNAFAQEKGTKNNRFTTNQASPGTQTPDLVRMVGPVRQDQDLRSLPYIAQKPSFRRLLTRYPYGTGQTGATPAPADYDTSGLTYIQQLLKNIWRPAPTMPPPLLTFEGINYAQTGYWPPDTDGDVGPNHYVEVVNDSFKVFDKNGNTLAGPTTFNSFFAPLGTGNPCGNNQNRYDPFVFYDQIADRWVVTDFAYPSFPGSSFWECIGVSQTGDPVSGGWFLYALQNDPANPNRQGDYPKFALWNNPQPGGAYFLTMNLFTDSATFNGVRVYALDRASMLSGGPTNAIGFSIDPAALGDAYSLVAATFRAGNPPPGGEDEFLLAIDSPAHLDTVLTQVKGWLFHADFVNPNLSTLGVGANHAPNALIIVDPFVNAFTNAAGVTIIPQQGTAQKLDSLGILIMTPVVYQNRGSAESLWADHTVCTDENCTLPTAVRWYQFDVTGGNFPATPVQQQNWTNGNDGLWRFMPSIAVDADGNTAIGYSTSSTAIFPSIRYAGRLATDPPSNLGQGEAIMTVGGGSQTALNRWGDYTMTTIDPSDGHSFWHVNEYYPTSAGVNWHTRVGKFQFPAGSPTPTATATATPTASATATATPTATPRPSPTPRSSPTPRPRPTPAPRP